MNALERNEGDFAHRGQLIGMKNPPGVTVFPGQALHITTSAPWAWAMPARVVEVQPNRVATIEPGAALKNPEDWFVVDWPEPAGELAAVGATHEQGELF